MRSKLPKAEIHRIGRVKPAPSRIFSFTVSDATQYCEKAST